MTKWRTQVVRDTDGFVDLSDWWNQQPAAQEIPYLNTRILQCWIQGFVGADRHVHVPVLFKDEHPVAAVPMYGGKNAFRSLSHHIDPFDVVTAPDSETTDYLPKWLSSRGIASFHKLRQESPLVVALPTQPRWRLDRIRTSPFVDLSRGIDEARSATSRNHRRSLRRRWRRLGELGEVRFLDHPDEVPGTLQRCFELEARGWKGAQGRAVLQRPEHERWYRSLAEVAQANGWLRLSTLTLNERLIAFAYDLVYGANRFGLLTSYAESSELSRLSVGNLLLDRILEKSAAEGLGTYRMGHGTQEAKLHWTDQALTIYDITVYGSGLVPGLKYLRRSLRERRQR